jgi:hypothetical protein
MLGRSAAMLLAAATGITLAGCSDSAMPTEEHMAEINLANVSQSSASAQALNDLRRITAPLHDLDAALSRNYSLLIETPLTAPDGCISNMSAGGMGYHYSQFDNLGDNTINLLDPEFLVYAPQKGANNGSEARRRLGALEYFIPYSDVWPGPDDPNFDAAPRTSDFSSFNGLPDVEMTPTAFNGWALHIWLWEPNPDGMMMNFNTAVPLCGS